MRRSKRIIFKIKREAIKLVKLVNRPQYNKLFYQLLCDLGVNMGGGGGNQDLYRMMYI